MDSIRQDLRYAMRALFRARLFTITVMLTLGLGIGANTAIFSFIDALLLRALPYPDADRLVMVWQDFGATGGPVQEWFTPPDYEELVQQSTTLAGASPLLGWGPNLTGTGEPERLSGQIVSTDFFDMVGVPPVLGRGFVAGDAEGEGRVVVVSDGFWQRRFGGDRGVLGRTLLLNGLEYEVVGVMPADFRTPFGGPTDVWRPYTRSIFSAGCGRGCYVMQVLARVESAFTVDQARADIGAIGAAIARAFPAEKRDMRFTVIPLREQLAGPTKPALYALLAAVGMMLLIACVNIANLLLARAGGREREVAVRTAMGASRKAVLRQLLTESIVLGLAGGVAGLLLAFWGVDLLIAMSPTGTPRLDEVAVNGTALMFALGLSVVTGLLFGLMPALQLSRVDVAASLKEAGGLREGIERRRATHALVVAEIAITLTLLTGAGLLTRSFARLVAVDPGFRPEHTLVVRLQLPDASYPEAAQVNAFWDQLIERIGAHPQVVAAAATSVLPLSGFNSDVSFVIEGRPVGQGRDNPAANYRSVTPGLFDALGMRLLRGRGLTAQDREGAPAVVVINQSMADRFWPGTDPIGARISTRSSSGPWVTVVGVVADVHHDGLDLPVRPEMYLPHRQLTDGGMTLVVRTRDDAPGILPIVRAEVRTLDANLPLSAPTTLEELVAQSVAIPRLYVSFFGFFAFVALLLAGVGIFGVTAHAVGRRTQEIGIRIALGARSHDVVAIVLRQTMVVTTLGLVLGLALGLALSRTIRTLLFRTDPSDPVTFLVIMLVFASVAFTASVLPALRATRVDPAEALRRE